MTMLDEISNGDLIDMVDRWPTVENLALMGSRLLDSTAKINAVQRELDQRTGQLNEVLFRLAVALGYEQDDNGLINVGIPEILSEIESELSEED